MPDQTLNCRNCNSEFVFSQGEQIFYKRVNLTAPKLCPICRSIKQQSQKLPPKPPQKSF